MAQYKPLRVGVDDKEAVSKMQQALFMCTAKHRMSAYLYLPE